MERFFNIFFSVGIFIFSWKAGVASSLNYIKLDENQTQSPILIPYPSWETNTIESSGPRTNVGERIGGHDSAAQATVSDVALKNNASIISTFRIRVDECDRLWVMDSGLAGILEAQPKQIAPPALVIFDLNTDTLINGTHSNHPIAKPAHSLPMW